MTARCSPLLLLLLLLLLAAGCPGSAPVQRDGSQRHPGDPAIWPDFFTTPQTPDRPRSPDVTRPADQAGYTGAPFGCQQDSDCFGQKCCLTPWGVKLCAARC